MVEEKIVNKESKKWTVFNIAAIFALVIMAFSLQRELGRFVGYLLLPFFIFSFIINLGRIEKTVLFFVTWFFLIFLAPFFLNDYLFKNYLLSWYLNYFFGNIVNLIYVLFDYDLSREVGLVKYALYMLSTFLFSGLFANLVMIICNIIAKKKTVFEIRSFISYSSIVSVCLFLLFVLGVFGPQISQSTRERLMFKYKNNNIVPNSEYFCKLIGGMVFGMLSSYEKCYPPALDAGKSCTDDKQCESDLCVVAKNNKSSGKCYEYRGADVCNTPRHIRNGNIKESVVYGAGCIY